VKRQEARKAQVTSRQASILNSAGLQSGENLGEETRMKAQETRKAQATSRQASI